MHSFSTLSITALAAISPALANILPRSEAPASYSTRALGTALGGALDLDAPKSTTLIYSATSTAGSAGVTEVAKVAQDGGPLLTINVVNSLPTPVSISYGSNFGAPTPIGNPDNAMLGTATSTSIVFPSDWAGRLAIGNAIDDAASKIEASLTAPDYVPNVDISYVDGYTVPITCSCAGTPVTGCNIELFNTGITCANLGSDPICYNPQAHANDGPADPFFAPCQGAAYTYPNDNLADMGCPGVYEFDCCLGTDCPAPARQSPAPSKAKREITFQS